MTNTRLQSRRDFLATSALGFVGLACGAKNLASREELPLDDELLYVGTYTDGSKSEGIYLVRFDRRSGQLRLIGSVNAGLNPSFLAVHPNGPTLYTVNEGDDGAVTAFSIAGDGSLTRLGTQSSQGAGPCYLSVDRSGRVVLVANYDGGSVAMLPIQSDGAVAAATSVIKHTGSGPNAERQHEPHAHCIVADPSDHFVLAADLGADRVFVYRLDLNGGALRRVEGGDAVMRPGAGPRHVAFHPTLPLVYVACELDSTVATLRFDNTRGLLSLVDARSTLPSGWKGENFPADIHVSPSGRTLYVSNRGHNSMAVFAIATDGAASLDQNVSTQGDWPRNFSLDPSGRWLLVANQRSNSIIVFARDDQTGRLTTTGHRLELPSPVCLRFRAPIG
ncbi:MAG TPA: lactonase family protein [Gemmatimonadaceae bacterium]|nr:lactonase family protein [Gemmatimonadaceae bacterium]